MKSANLWEGDNFIVGSGRVMFREVGGKVAFDGDVCRDSTETELSCRVNAHYLSFDKADYSFIIGAIGKPREIFACQVYVRLL